MKYVYFFKPLQDPPYVFIKKEYDEEVKQLKAEGKRVCGNHYFEGFCIDLAQKVTEVLNITNYTICVVQDGQYGSIQANQTWNGMIGELMQKVGSKQINLKKNIVKSIVTVNV